jgi:hypothetical protein
MERRKNDFPAELLIVIALLLIMAATAIPNLLCAVIADHESLTPGPGATPGTAGISRKSLSPRH